MRTDYTVVNSKWPASIPALSREEAISAAKRLYRFAVKKPLPVPIKETSGRRYTAMRFDDTGKRVLLLNTNGGYCTWKDLIHFMSHICHRRISREPGHGLAHRRLEAEMIEYVIRSGWLDGKLKRPKKEKPQPTKADVQTVRYQRIVARIKAWETKKKRAETALKKLAKARRYYEQKAPVILKLAA